MSCEVPSLTSVNCLKSWDYAPSGIQHQSESPIIKGKQYLSWWAKHWGAAMLSANGIFLSAIGSAVKRNPVYICNFKTFYYEHNHYIKIISFYSYLWNICTFWKSLIKHIAISTIYFRDFVTTTLSVLVSKWIRMRKHLVCF